MAGSLLSRALGAIELLAANPSGLPLQAVSDALGIPKSAAHRLLAELMALGHARQDAATARYLLTTRLISMALGYLARSGIGDVVQPVIDRLAGRSAELVRLGVIEGRFPSQRLVWVAKAQGAHGGLRYDPDMGAEAALSCTASGHAWLACLSDEDALTLVSRQGLSRGAQRGPNAPRTLKEVLARLKLARAKGYARVVDSASPGMAALAAAVRHPVGGQVLGIVSVAGPSARLTEAQMQTIVPALLEAAHELGMAHGGSSLFSAQATQPAQQAAAAAPGKRRAARV